MKKLVELTEEQMAMLKEKGQEVIEMNDLDSFIGHAWYFRTVTYHLVGRVTKRIGSFLLLEEASWVADSGRFMNAIKDGTLNEVEPVGPALVNLDTVSDAFPWSHKLPSDQK
jgi:hypothetical protein